MNKKSKTEIFLGLVLLIIAFGLGMAFKKSGDQLLQQTIQTPAQQQYVQAGASDPAIISPEVVSPEKIEATPVPVAVNNNCYVGGCSGQICSDTPGAISTCEFSDAYSCYKSDVTSCKRQPDGQCGWTQTPALAQCLNDHPVQFQ